MGEYEMIRLRPEDYRRCSAIWDMDENPERTRMWYDELVNGNRMTYIYTEGGEYLGEGALVLRHWQPDYTAEGVRVCLSRLIVAPGHRGRGIGGVLVDYLIDRARELGFREMSLGVDIDNASALRLYRKKGFDTTIFEGEDEQGKYVKLLKML